jgi:hypothetical protein
MPADPSPTADECHRATNPATLLDREDPSSPYLEDAAHWITVYGELLAMKADLLAAAADNVKTMSEDARADANFDQRLLRAQTGRYQKRLEYWRSRIAELTAERDLADLPDPLPLVPGQEPPSTMLERLRRDER